MHKCDGALEQTLAAAHDLKFIEVYQQNNEKSSYKALLKIWKLETNCCKNGMHKCHWTDSQLRKIWRFINNKESSYKTLHYSMKSYPIKHLSDASGYLLIFGLPEKLPDLRIERNQFHPLSLFLRHIHTKPGHLELLEGSKYTESSNSNIKATSTEEKKRWALTMYNLHNFLNWSQLTLFHQPRCRRK